jgi:hypothetical protein
MCGAFAFARYSIEPLTSSQKFNFFPGCAPVDIAERVYQKFLDGDLYEISEGVLPESIEVN